MSEPEEYGSEADGSAAETGSTDPAPAPAATAAAGGAGVPDGPSEPGGTLTPDEFEALVRELHIPLMATALRLTRNRAEAEDLVQESLYRGFRSLASFRKGSRFRAWMFRILRNTFINRSRREAKAPTALDPTEMSPPSRADVIPDIRDLGELPGLTDAHFDDRVKQAVARLPEVYRLPLVLFALGDLSYQEIADSLEVPIGTVMSRLHRARKQMREDLLDYARDEGFGTGER